MNSERRARVRHVLYSPEYLDMGADNGGMIVNLSETGLEFQAISPVLPQTDIPISFSLETGYRIDVKARVVWVSSTGKIGGVIFHKLSKDSHSLIHEWLVKAEADHERVARQRHEARDTSPATREIPAPTAHGVHDTAAPSASSPIRPTREPLLTAAAAREVTAVPAIQQGVLSVSRSPEQKSETPSSDSVSVASSISGSNRGDAAASSISQMNVPPLFPSRDAENVFARSPSHAKNVRQGRRSGRLFALGLVIAIAAAGAFYVRTHRRQVGAAIASIGERLAGKPESSVYTSSSSAPSRSGGAAHAPNAPQANRRPLPVQRSSAKPPRASPAQSTQLAANTAQSTVSLRTAAQPHAPDNALAHAANGSAHLSDAEPKGVNPSTISPVLPAAGQSEYRRAEDYLNGTGVAQDYGQAAQWFWRSLEAGYTSAAVPLANLYLEGTGVSRSCTQARILLDVAAQKSNPQAIQQLAQLPENCQ